MCQTANRIHFCGGSSSAVRSVGPSESVLLCWYYCTAVLQSRYLQYVNCQDSTDENEFFVREPPDLELSSSFQKIFVSPTMILYKVIDGWTLILFTIILFLVQSNGKLGKSQHAQKRQITEVSPSVWYGSDPTFKLGQCEGDCDTDSSCRGNDLVCLQRGPYESVPGCSGGETDATYSDYCVRNSDLAMPRLSWSTNFPLGRCQGDCDKDIDCQGNLICFQRNEHDTVPHCLGNDWSRTDYCIPPLDPVTTPQPSPPPTPSPADNTRNTNLRFGTTFPLGRCEGDCDSNNHCQDGLVCFQRNNNVDVPACQGGTSDSTLTDYCIPAEVFPAVSTSAPGTISNSRLKLYWQLGYYWQEEIFERKWCMFCKNGPCQERRKLHIHRCQSSSQSFDIIPQWGKYYIIKLHDHDLCLGRSGGTSTIISTIKCDGSNELQLWFASSGNFAGPNFEISPMGDKHLCMTQRHHPKFGEDVRLEPCSTARGDETSSWNRY
jgi:hypothetical protein